jgi:hypothetical protein
LGSQLTTAEDLSGGASLEALLRGVWSMGVGGSAFHGPWLDGGLRSVPCGSITMGDCSRSVVLSDHLASGRAREPRFRDVLHPDRLLRWIQAG